MDLRDRGFLDDEGRRCLRGKRYQRSEGKKQDKWRRNANWHAPILADGSDSVDVALEELRRLALLHRNPAIDVLLQHAFLVFPRPI